MERISNKQLREIVTAILKGKKLNYNDWLYEQHMSFLSENSSVILSSLKPKETKKTEKQGVI